jgi:small-conductance mechanosensitive channel
VPKCYLRGYGDSSVDFILHYWVDDVTLGRWEPESDILFSIWRKFKENDIEIPFPQRDIHLRSPEIIQVKDNGN